MGDGLDRAGYKQIAGNVDCTLITSTMGNTTGSWALFEVISSGAQIALVTAAGMTNSSLITSETTYPQGARIGCSQITVLGLSTGTTDGTKTASKVIAYSRILL